MASFSTKVTLSAELLQSLLTVFHLVFCAERDKASWYLSRVGNPAIAPLPVCHSFADYMYRCKLTQLMYSAETSSVTDVISVWGRTGKHHSPFPPPLCAASVWLTYAIYRVDLRNVGNMATSESIFVHICSSDYNKYWTCNPWLLEKFHWMSILIKIKKPKKHWKDCFVVCLTFIGNLIKEKL